MEQRHGIRVDDLQRASLLFGQDDIVKRGGGTGGQLQQPAVARLPARGRRTRRAGGAYARRQHGADDLDERDPVVVGDQPRQLDLVRQE